MLFGLPQSTRTNRCLPIECDFVSSRCGPQPRPAKGAARHTTRAASTRLYFKQRPKTAEAVSRTREGERLSPPHGGGFGLTTAGAVGSGIYSDECPIEYGFKRACARPQPPRAAEVCAQAHSSPHESQPEKRLITKQKSERNYRRSARMVIAGNPACGPLRRPLLRNRPRRGGDPNRRSRAWNQSEPYPRPRARNQTPRYFRGCVRGSPTWAAE